MPIDCISANAVIVRKGVEENRLLVVKLKPSIAATDGDTLDVAYESFFSYKFNPFHTTAGRIRLDIGRFVSDIPDDTINQLIWKWSNRADVLRSTGLKTDEHYGTGALDGGLLAQIKSDYVAAKVALDLLAGSPDDAGYQKSLADLRISRSGGALRNAIEKAQNTCFALEQALKEGGFLGQRVQAVIKGGGHLDRPAFGRLWSTGPMPSVQSKVWSRGGTRAQKAFGARKFRGRGSF